MNFNNYQTDGFYDELVQADGLPRPDSRPLIERIETLEDGEFERRQEAAERDLMLMGITFNVYGDTRGRERILPFDMVPRVVGTEEWDWLERGLKQRIQALNMFIDDVYHDQRILNEGIIPKDFALAAQGFRPECMGIDPPQHIWCHIAGTDIVRDADGQFYVLEDNLRVPSGVSYVLQNRAVLKQTFPRVFEGMGIRPVDDYPGRLLSMLESVAPNTHSRAEVVVLTPGQFNSAYFEHSFLAQQMGVELVEGRDLAVVDGKVYTLTTSGLEQVHVIYRRIDDDFIDPQVFRPDSMLGVPGLMEAYRLGNVTLVNAPGTGVADDKAIYSYIPQMVRYYLDEDIIIPNVPTYVCWDANQMQHVLTYIEDLVVKPVNESGGYGLLVGPHASSEEHEDFRNRIRENPRNYIAQPTLSLSRVPTFIEGQFEGRHVDLRPFVLHGEETYVLPGGLTRVALRRGSLVVNSSQGGGSKDTWVLV